MPGKQRNPWFLTARPRPDAALRLFCLPFAGTGASLFHGWYKVFPPNFDVLGLQLPGRESRIQEPLLASVDDVAKAIANVLTAYVDRPYALFGYSVGALWAFEAVRELRRRGKPLPVCLFAAASHAPQARKPNPPLAHLPRDQFLDRIRYFYEPSEAAWEVPELLDLMLPILRNDVAIYDAYQYENEAPLNCPIEAYVGEADRGVPVDTVAAWERQTTAEFELTMFPGGHFFMKGALSRVQGKIRQRLLQLTETVA